VIRGRSRSALAAAISAALALTPPVAATASGGTYTFDGGTTAERSQVRAALNASSFDWGLIPVTIVVHIRPDLGASYAIPGEVFVDAAVLDMDSFGWAIVQHEFGHEVDFFLLDDAKRATLKQALGVQAWCSSTPPLPHSADGCERFASLVSWAYWPSPANALRPRSAVDEAGGIAPADFRALLDRLLDEPNGLSTQAVPRVFAPSVTCLARQSNAWGWWRRASVSVT
jgi:hypothetical protein